MTDRTALEAARDALPDADDLAHEIAQDCLSFGLSSETIARYLHSYVKKMDAALNSIEREAAALSSPPVLPAEPVAWRYQDARGHFRYRAYTPGFDVEYAILKPVPLYAAPVLPAPDDARDAGPDIAFRLKTARMLAEFHAEETLSEQQCARHMGLDLVTWRRLEDCFSRGVWTPEGDEQDFPHEDSESILRAAMQQEQQ